MKGPPRLHIGGGARRGLELRAPRGIRPTSARLREALFNIWGRRLSGARFLDLFAGSGIVGMEAVSRGAAEALLIEGERSSLTMIRENLRRARLPNVGMRSGKLPDDLHRCLPKDARFDLIFADPPYGFGDLGGLVRATVPYLAAGGEIAVEHGWRDAVPVTPLDLELADRRRYGDSGLSFFHRRDEATEPSSETPRGIGDSSAAER
jgi:16S rRNA (guanine(966)-N(2))-methyltransferase RsmD